MCLIVAQEEGVKRSFTNCNLLKLRLTKVLKTSELKMLEMFTIINNINDFNI